MILLYSIVNESIVKILINFFYLNLFEFIAWLVPYKCIYYWTHCNYFFFNKNFIIFKACQGPRWKYLAIACYFTTNNITSAHFYSNTKWIFSTKMNEV